MEVKLKQLIVILLIIFVSCGNVRSFDYIIESHSKREIIKSYPISKDKKYLNEMNIIAKDNGVKSLLIMCDNEGNLGDPNNEKRNNAVENHRFGHEKL